MAMETKLYLRQQQKLVMTIMLQQAIKLLPLTRLELVQRINQELVENPFLEDVDSLEEEAEENKEAEEPEAEDLSGDGAADDLDWENYIQENFDNTFSNDDIPEGYSLENTLRHNISLNDHFFSQLVVSTTHDLPERQIGSFLIGNIDERGYLQCQIEEVVSSLGVEAHEVEKALSLIHSFDPPGVGARDLRECLLLQLKALEDRDALAEDLIQYHLDELNDANLTRLAHKLKVPLGVLLAAVRHIRELDPQPGRKFDPETVEYIIPDAMVVKVNDEYQVVLNEEDVPRLRINSFYRRVLKQRNNSDETAREFLHEKLKSAVWLIKSIEQRRQTLYKVCKSLVKFQSGFLDYGISHLKPLVLRDVAEDIEMHESTVSRVVTNKYIHTPQGLFELKFFFHSGINFMDGSTMSSVAVKRLLQNMINQEDGEKPLTDQEIVEILRDKRIQIARRTVAKYRKELKIPSSGSRKRSFNFQASVDGSAS